MDFNNILSMLGSNPQLAQSLMQMMSGGKGGAKMDNNAMMSILPQLFGGQNATNNNNSQPTMQNQNAYAAQPSPENFANGNVGAQFENANNNPRNASQNYTGQNFATNNMPIDNEEVNFTMFKLSQE